MSDRRESVGVEKWVLAVAILGWWVVLFVAIFRASR